MNVDLRLELMIPEFIVVGTAIVVLVLDAVLHRPHANPDDGPRALTAWLSFAGCLGASAWLLFVLVGEGSATSFGGLFLLDPFSVFFKVVVLVGAGLSLLLSDAWLRQHRLPSGASHALVLLSTAGMMYVVSAGDLLMLFLGLEVMSVPIYCLAASLRWDDRSVEAGVKYLVLGSFATAIFLFGLALLYAFIGLEGRSPGMGIALLHATISGYAGPLPLYAFAGGLLALVGLLFKISAAPFHMWTPDVYEGAPTAITAFMSVAVKATAAATLLRVFGGPVLEMMGLDGLMWGVAALTMIVGNVMALVQDNVKRMLAYSSIAHGGYILVGLLAGSAEAEAGILYYALAYTVGNVAAFGVLVHLSRRGHDVQTLDDLAGAGVRHPWVGAVMIVAMLSLIGIPPFAGFFAKFTIFAAAVAEGLVGLTVLALISSAISVGCYLRPLVAMYMREPTAEAPPPQPLRLRLALAILLATAAVVGLGLVPGGALDWAAASTLLAAG